MNRQDSHYPFVRALLSSVPVLLIVVALFGVLRFGFPAVIATQPGSTLNSPLPSGMAPSAMAPSPSPFDSPLPSPSPLPTPTELPGPMLEATKEADLLQQQQTRDAARLTPQPTGTLVVDWTPPPATPRPTAYGPVPDTTPAGAGGIVAIRGPFQSSMFLGENAWYMDTEGGRTRLVVYAGAVPENATLTDPVRQGAVIVQVERLSLQDGRTVAEMLESHLYLTPQQAGPVRVIGAAGEQLELQSTTGVIFYFDVPSRQFVSSLTDGSPTPTPPAEP